MFRYKRSNTFPLQDQKTQPCFKKPNFIKSLTFPLYTYNNLNHKIHDLDVIIKYPIIK